VKKMLAVVALAAVVLVSPTAMSQTISTITKIGKLRVFAPSRNSNLPGSTKFGRADGGTFEGCTVDPAHVYTNPPVNQPAVNADDALQVLLLAKQNGLDVLVGYVVDSGGVCRLRRLELQ